MIVSDSESQDASGPFFSVVLGTQIRQGKTRGGAFIVYEKE